MASWLPGAGGQGLGEGMWKLPAAREEVSFWDDETAQELGNCYDHTTQ